MVVPAVMHAAPEALPAKPVAYWPPAIAMMGVHMAFAWCLLTTAILAPVLAPIIGHGTEILGYYGATIWVAGLAAVFVIGPAIRRFGAVRMSQVCAFCFGASVLMGQFGTLWAFAIGAVLAGFAAASESPASSALLIRIAPPERRAFVFSFKQIGVPVGGFLAGFVIPALLLLVGWRGVMLAVSLGCFALCFVLEPIRRRYDPPVSARLQAMMGNPLRDMAMGWRICWRIPAMRPLLFVNAPYSAFQFCTNTFLVVRLVSELHLSLEMAGAMLAIFQIGGLIGRLSLGWISDRFASPRAILIAVGISMLATGGMIAGYPAAWPAWPLFAVTAIAGITANGWNGVYMAEVARLVPTEEAGRASAVAMMASIAGVIVAPLAVGWIAAAHDFGTALAVITATAAIGLVALLRR